MRAFILIAIGIVLTTTGFESRGATPTSSHRAHKTSHRRQKVTHRKAQHMAAATGCGGTERWDVKDGSDQGARDIHPTVVNGITIADLNQLPAQPFDPDGRMQEEKVIYKISGVLRLFKHETDSDYHIVIADSGTVPYSTGHSMVIEVPDPSCVSGPHHQFGASQFLQQLQDSRSDFEGATRSLPRNRDLGSRNIPITITGVLFFDFMHGQTGHGLPHPSQDSDTRDKVVELHPVLCNDVGGYREKEGKGAC